MKKSKTKAMINRNFPSFNRAAPPFSASREAFKHSLAMLYP
jgi:hypothetical protein